jgi:DNA repair exonuclease SbcCD nuclease subunit
MKILHTADIHLRQYGDERWQTLKTLIDIGKKEKIEVFAISGDLFDEKIDAENLRPKIREIFSDTGFNIVIIPGNHDHDVYKDMYFGEDAKVLTDIGKPFEHKDVMMWGLPFEPIEEAKILEKLHYIKSKLCADKTNILLYHGELLDTFFSRRDFGEEGEGRYMPLKLSYLKGINVQYVLGGHFHSNFDVRTLENGGYFVYPGSPISITRREIGQRKVNIFEVGKSPKAYPLDTYHFEEVLIEFDPVKNKNPVETVKAAIEKAHPNAQVILTVRGFINSEEIKMKEPELVKLLKRITRGKCAEEHFEFQDVHTILEDDLFKSFLSKLQKCDYDDEKKKQLRDIAIKAMMESRA